MSKITLNSVSDITQSTSAQTTINSNSSTVQTAFDNTLSRDGTSPNQMGAALDMNSNQIINLPVPSSSSSPARLIDVVSNPTIVIPGTGTSGHVVPFLDGNNTFSGVNVIPGYVTTSQVRIQLVATLNLYVNVGTGNDANTGLSAGTPFRTIQHAIDVVCFNYDLNSNQVIINVAAGNYPENIQTKVYTGGSTFFGYQQVVIKATDPTPANTKINPVSGVALFGQDNSDTPYTFKGFQLESPGNTAALVECDSGGLIALDGCFFGTTSGFHCLSIYQSRIVFINSPFSIVGGSSVFASTANMGQILIQPGKTVTLVGTPTFTFFFAQATQLSQQTWTGTTFVGACTCGRYDVESNSVINTGGGKSSSSATIGIGSPAAITWVAHKLIAGEPVVFTGSVPTGITVGTTYWVSTASLATDTFQIADTLAHALAGTNSINTSGSSGAIVANAPNSLLPGSVLGTLGTGGLIT